MGVSVPVTWDEWPGLGSGAHWHCANIDPRMQLGNLPWEGYEAARRRLAGPMKTLGLTARKV